VLVLLALLVGLGILLASMLLILVLLISWRRIVLFPGLLSLGLLALGSLGLIIVVWLLWCLPEIDPSIIRVMFAMLCSGLCVLHLILGFSMLPYRGFHEWWCVGSNEFFETDYPMTIMTGIMSMLSSF
jgi:hypothetical protein